MKTIRMELSAGSIAAGIRELHAYKAELKRKTELYVRRLVENGVEIAKLKVVSLGAFDSGELASSLDGMMYAEGNKGCIFTDCGHAAYVEFGTGVVGAASPHPTQGWSYDVNKHGEDGWWYWDAKQGRLRWTKGIPSRPFLYETARELERDAVALAREVFQA